MELITIVIGILLGVLGMIGIGKIFPLKDTKSYQLDQIYSFVDNMKSVGELVVFKAFTKEIVTAAENWFGDFGKKYLNWLVSNKKMAMVFQFEINFWYDLRSPDFTAYDDAREGKFIIKMPQCLYDISIKNISFYDEQKAKLLPWLLPPLLSEALGKSPNEENRNRLKDEALKQASIMASQLTKPLSSEIEKSARQTMEMLAKSFGAKSVMLDFSTSELSERSVIDVSPQQIGET